DYVRTGGYRPEFYYAQDFDLWLRLSDLGTLAFLPECFYEARFNEGCISSLNRHQQVELAMLAMESSALRKRGGNDSEVLRKAQQIRPCGSSESSARFRA